MGRRIDFTGQRFGRLLVLKKLGKNKYNKYLYECQCDCGNPNHVIILGNSLQSGRTLSCGCLQLERIHDALKKHNTFDISGNYGIGYFIRNNLCFLFDLEDFDRIKDFYWYSADLNYVVTTNIESKTNVTILSRFLLNAKTHEIVDHINRNPLDNRKENLRLASPEENSMNRSLILSSKTNVSGVGWSKTKNKWRAYIGYKYKFYHLGYFHNIEDAIKVRLIKEKELFKDFSPQKNLFDKYGI